MKLAGQETPDEVVRELDRQTRLLRATLILEEALETIDALGVSVYYNRHNIIGPKPTLKVEKRMRFLDFVDGCADIAVVTTGSLVAAGVDDEPVQREVDAANLRKFTPPRCPNCGEEMEPKPANGIPDGVRYWWICPVGGEDHTQLSREQGPYKRGDGKWVKPPYFKDPDIEGAVEKGDITYDPLTDLPEAPSEEPAQVTSKSKTAAEE